MGDCRLEGFDKRAPTVILARRICLLILFIDFEQEIWQQFLERAVCGILVVIIAPTIAQFIW